LNFLSQAGKEVFFKAVIQAIPSYSMSMFMLPKSLHFEINALMQNFWWGQQNNDSKIHWISWRKMEVAKSSQGAGWASEIFGVSIRLFWLNNARDYFMI
jgi:hypothetical protein